MKVIRISAVALALTLLAIAPPRDVTTSSFCSRIGYPGVLTNEAVFFLGSALSDTVFAGPGDVEFKIETGHFGPAGERGIYGQMVAVERFAGPANALRADVDSVVVVVPWDYDGSCATTAWTRSARFVRPRKRGFFRPTLRPVEHWVGGIPTFDAFAPQFQAFPSALDSGIRSSTRRGEGVLSADELYQLHELLPTVEQLDASDWRAAETVMTWARRNPGRLNAYPARNSVRSVALAADNARARRMVPAIAGTYEVTVELPGGGSHVFFVRTGLQPSRAWFPSSTATDGEVLPVWIPRARGYDLYFWHGRSILELPTDSAAATRAVRGEWPLKVTEIPVIADGAAEWRASFEVAQLARSLPGEPEVDSFVEAFGESYRELVSSGRYRSDAARFVLRSDGEMIFSLDVPVESGGQLQIRGRRLSLQTISDRVR